MNFKKLWYIVAMAALLAFIFTGCIPVEKVPLYFSVVEYNSGPAVEGV
ncbi:MAG: hypothetical protein PWP37_1061, partial [Thermotogota bacterium]|nr:hypothetical protein [Thermotogota bacterium]